MGSKSKNNSNNNDKDNIIIRLAVQQDTLQP